MKIAEKTSQCCFVIACILCLVEMVGREVLHTHDKSSLQYRLMLPGGFTVIAISIIIFTICDKKKTKHFTPMYLFLSIMMSLLAISIWVVF